MMFSKINDRAFAQFTSFILAVFATLDSSYPAATYPFLWAHLLHVYKDQEGLQAGGNNTMQELLNFQS